MLAIIYRDYDVGSGGGQLSNLIHSVMQMRSQGFKPSKANRDAIVEALDHRPNQGPLVQALKETLAYQTKQQKQMEAMQGSGGGSPVHRRHQPVRPEQSQRAGPVHRHARKLNARREAALDPGLPG